MQPLRAIIAATLALAGASCAMPVVPAPPAVTRDGVRFVLIKEDASSVSLAGTFNQWSPSSHPLVRQKAHGPWTIVVPLPPGEHAFMFLVDGKQWVSPPMAEDYADDGFGARNGIVVVRR